MGPAAAALGCLAVAACGHDWDGAYDDQFSGTGGTANVGGSAGSPVGGVAGSEAGGAGGVIPVAGQAGHGGVPSTGGGGEGGGAGSAGVSGVAGAAGSAGSAGSPGCVQSLVTNGGFEDSSGVRPQSWVLHAQLFGRLGTWRSSTAAYFEGTKSLAMDTLSAVAEGAGEYTLAVATETPFVVTAGEALTLYGAVRVDQAAVGQIPPSARFVYYDAGGTYLPALDGPPHDLLSASQWTSFGPILETVPSGAAQAGLVLTVRRVTLTYFDAICVSR